MFEVDAKERQCEEFFFRPSVRPSGQEPVYLDEIDVHKCDSGNAYISCE
jgi:hypothetical protein